MPDGVELPKGITPEKLKRFYEGVLSGAFTRGSSTKGFRKRVSRNLEKMAMLAVEYRLVSNWEGGRSIIPLISGKGFREESSEMGMIEKYPFFGLGKHLEMEPKYEIYRFWDKE
tara:strand:+ start:422 stop:763 length:342 start_codon:yes stop_codon:yes gene_type:complete